LSDSFSIKTCVVSDRRLTTQADYVDDLRAWSAEMSQPLASTTAPVLIGLGHKWATQSVLPLAGRAAYQPRWGGSAVTQPTSWVMATMVGSA
jgi:hypothetical protein